MADLATIERALRNADAAGDTEAAAQLAEAYRAAQAEQPSPAAPAKKKPNAVVDVARAIPGGIAQGAAGVIGLPGDLMRLAQRGQTWIGNKVVESFGGKGIPLDSAGEPVLPGSESANRVLSAPTGGYYQPKTAAGRYAETLMTFLPGALVPGSNARRVANVALPATLSQTGGELTEGSDLEPYARVAGAVAGGVAAGPTVRSINAISSRMGAPLENPEIAARTMLADAVRRDGGTQAVRTNLDDWQGASSPAVIDVTGNNVRRLVRSAASGGSGEAQNVAVTYADRIAGNLQDNALTLTRRLTPDYRYSASRYADELDEAQRTAASTEYAAPYSQPATVTREMVSALQGPEGRGAIAQAYATARARRDSQQMAELQDLMEVAGAQSGGRDAITGRVRSLEQALGELSAGSLDRVRIAMRETGRSLAARGRNAMAGGYRDRVRDIDTALDQTDGLREARANYAGFERQKEALDLGGTGPIAPPEDYAATIAELAGQAPGAQSAAGIGYRQALTDSISRPAEGQTGVLNRVATSSAQSQNLAATYGEEIARRYQTGVGNEIDRVRNSRFISPNTGSQTELRLQDAGLLDIPTNSLGIVAKVWDKIKSSAQLTDQERTALVRMGTSEAQLRDLARANPSLTSRVLTQAVLGQNSGQR